MTTRERVKRYLKGYPYSTVRQLAVMLCVSTSTIRFYLRELDAQDLLGKQLIPLSAKHAHTWEYYLKEES